MSKVILVTGATGKQGGAVIDALKASDHLSGYTILALTRNINSPSAKKLAEYDNIKLVAGDLNNVPAIFVEAAKVVSDPIWGIFSVQAYPLRGKGSDPAIEVKQGKDLIDTAVTNGVSFFVYASVDRGGDNSSQNKTPIPHFATKLEIEKHLLENAKTMKWTILRPVTFMDVSGVPNATERERTRLTI
jgi:uncharacterized protein YbjT (DUF2867 family)